MKKISITCLVAVSLFAGTVKAQSLQDGVNDMYAERFKSAIATFEKLLAANPNNIEATYWLGQTYLEKNDVASAKALYEKALLASANAPLVIVGMGQVELEENKISEAKQRFEAAITMTKGKKGNDPVILNAVGRAITEVYTQKDKKGDINYAIEKLEEAAQRDPKNASIFLNLGNAYRKGKPGEAGGLAFQNYQRATELNSKFAVPHYRTAMLFNGQRNWDLFQKHMEAAIEADPKFAPAYYELYYFKLYRQDYNNAQYYAQKFIENSDPDPQNEYLAAQTHWVKKEFDEAIAGAKNIIAKAGKDTKAPTYKLIADAYVQKKDTVAAKEYIDLYFANLKSGDEVQANDYKLKADIYSTIPGQEEVVLQAYQEGVAADTVLANKIDLLKQGAAFFNKQKKYDLESKLYDMLIEIKPTKTINEWFSAGYANYRNTNYERSYEIFTLVADSFPDQIYGWEWKFRNAQIIDTVAKDSIALPAAEALIKFTNNDTVTYAQQITQASYFLAMYYNEAGDQAKAVEYLKLMKSATTDPARKESIQKNIDALSANLKSSTNPSGTGAKNAGAGK
ncbi:MAG: tetratricopeptide repeat protein [Chitinophagaceae bacterium]|nr:tetratricopeptide repeat protein [Chitinophagaceae bacterium]